MSRQRKSRIAILVAGMHRSGTSVLARVLNILGCDLPKTLLNPGPTNERGHWESRKIVFLNDEILASAESSWRDWNPFNPQWYASPVADRFRERARTILGDEYGDSRFFVLKDPRICRLLPFWTDAVRDHGAEPMIVSPIRNPLDVAASLEKRDGIAPSIGHLLWLRHVLDAEAASRHLRRAYMRYDTLLSEAHTTMDAVGDALGISWPRRLSVGVQMEIDGFLSPELRHHRTDDTMLMGNPRLPQWIKSSFEVLGRWTRGDVHDKDAKILDRIRSALDEATPTFNRVLASSERLLAERDGRIEELGCSLVERDGRIEELGCSLVERDGRIEELGCSLVERDGRIEELGRSLVERDGRIEELGRSLVERDGRIEELGRSLVERDGRIEELGRSLVERDGRIEELGCSLVERDGRIEELGCSLVERDGRIEELGCSLVERDGRIEELGCSLVERDGRIEELGCSLVERDGRIEELGCSLVGRDEQIDRLYGSTSWRITAPIRHIKRSSQLILAKTRARSSWIARAVYRRAPLPVPVKIWTKEILFKSAPILFRHSGAYRNWETTKRDIISVGNVRDYASWGILTKPFGLFVAQSIERRLRRHGWDVHLMTELPDQFSHDFYVVMCPQVFKRLPPYEKLISFQMEQSVSLRWFTEDYLNILKNSRAILDYAFHNMTFLNAQGIIYPQLHYLPLGGEHRYNDVKIHFKKYDVLFYGDNIKSPRRQRMLAALRKKFDVVVINNTYGQDIKKAIGSARVVVNLHFYENALLETTRLWECLSLGTPVVSESTQNQNEYPEFKGVVTFFEEGSIEAMLLAVEEALTNPISKKAICNSVETSKRKFKFMFDRFLVAENFLPSNYVYSMDIPLPASADCIALSMPETADRRSLFLQESKHQGLPFTLFDGFRRQPGLVGCGLSHSILAKHALAHDFKRFTVMEDDVVFPEDFHNKLSIVHRFLDLQSDKWDVFSGVIAEIGPDTKVIFVNEFEGVTFVTINKMVSTVFNIYSERGLRILASWDPFIADGEELNIDQFIKKQDNLRVITTCPFLVGHRAEVESTVNPMSGKGFEYFKMISESQKKLEELVRSS